MNYLEVVLLECFLKDLWKGIWLCYWDWFSNIFAEAKITLHSNLLSVPFSLKWEILKRKITLLFCLELKKITLKINPINRVFVQAKQFSLKLKKTLFFHFLCVFPMNWIMHKCFIYKVNISLYIQLILWNILDYMFRMNMATEDDEIYTKLRSYI